MKFMLFFSIKYSLSYILLKKTPKRHLAHLVTPMVGVCYCSLFCCTLPHVHSSFAIILMGKNGLVALLILSSWCLVMVVWPMGLSAVCDCGIA